MSLPSPALSVPSLQNDQLSYQGVTFGNPIGVTSPFGIVKIEGLGKQKVRSGDTPRPQTRGAFPGLNLLDARTINLTMDIGPPFGAFTNLAGALSAVRAAASTEGVTEYPLWIQLPNLPKVACMARVTGFDPPYDVIADLGGLIKAQPLQWVAADPYFYSAPTINTTIGLPNPAGGFSFNLAFNLSFGAAGNNNSAIITNAGDVPCYPLLTITGPCINPTVQNQSLPGNPLLAFTVSLNAGDQIVIDCDMQTVLFASAGQTVFSPGAALLSKTVASTFFSIAPAPTVPGGANIIAFNSQDVSHQAGTVQVWSASAYSGLL